MRKWQWAMAVLLIGALGCQSARTPEEPPSAQVADFMGDEAYIPDIETFMQIGANASPQVSRDGTVHCFSSGMSGVTQVYRSDTFSDLSVLAGEIRWMDGGKTYRLTKAVGCGCNYNKLSIKSATQEGLINA